jgi:SOS-response transcriptional repressor LexA
MQFIVQYLYETGQAPLLTEIAQGLGIRSKGVVHRYVSRLAELGYITTGKGRHRGINLLNRGTDTIQKPAGLETPQPITSAKRTVLPLVGKILRVDR